MISILILLALSAVSGFVLGRNNFRWQTILAAAMLLAPASAAILQSHGFRDALSGISTVIACLTINQIAYLIGWLRVSGGPKDRPIEKLTQ